MEEVTPEWALPHLTRPTPSRIIRGLSPIQAGAARAIPAPEPVKRHPTEKTTAFDYDTTHDSQRSQNSNDQEASQPIQESPPDVYKLETPTLLNSLGITPDTDFDAGETNDADGHAQEEALQTLPGMPPEPAPALPEHDIRTFLQPLPPGWVQNQGFSVGLHPTTDVFELDDDAPRLPAHEEEDDTNPASGENPQNARDTSQDNDTSQREACEKGGETFPDSNARETSPCEKSSEELLDAEMTGYDDDGSSSTSGDNALHDDYEALDSEDPQDPGGVPEPRGEPPKLTTQQRSRLHQLLRSGDFTDQLQLRGEHISSDEDLWRAYRKQTREDYRALRKRKRAEGTWDKDSHRGRWTREDDRGWGPAHPNQDRSPIPRRRATSSSSRRVTPEQT